MLVAKSQRLRQTKRGRDDDVQSNVYVGRQGLMGGDFVGVGSQSLQTEVSSSRY